MPSQDFKDGFMMGWSAALGGTYSEGMMGSLSEAKMDVGIRKKAKRKIKQTPKQKLLTQMTAKKWNKYKKGSGKKTYVEIRAQVSRTQEFKRKAKRL